jgi:hypothetical protein
MAFAEGVVLEAWQRSLGRCQCTARGHGHQGRCNGEVEWGFRAADTLGGWFPMRKVSWDTDVLGNCEIRCSSCWRQRIRPEGA